MISDDDILGIDNDKIKGGNCSFQIDNLEFINLEMDEMKPKLKTNDKVIIVKNGKSRNNRNKGSLF